MKYCSYTNNLKKYFNKYFCKYKSKTRFNKFEYSVLKRMIYKEWYFDQDDTFEDWVYRSVVIGAVRNNNQSSIKQLPILYKGGQ